MNRIGNMCDGNDIRYSEENVYTTINENKMRLPASATARDGNDEYDTTRLNTKTPPKKDAYHCLIKENGAVWKKTIP